MNGLLGVDVDKDASFAIVATLPSPMSTDGLLARGFWRDVESLGKLAVGQPSFSHRHHSAQGVLFACTTVRLTNGYLWEDTVASESPVTPSPRFGSD